MSTYFTLRTHSKEAPSTILLRIRLKGEQIKLATKVKVMERDWNANDQRVTSGDPLADHKNHVLDRWRLEAGKALLMMDENEWTLEKVKDEIAIAMNVEVRRKDKSNSFLLYYHRWATTKTATKRILKLQDLTTWKILREFREPLSFDDITRQFYEDFCRWMDEVKNYKANTKGTQIKNIKAAMNAAYKDGLHDNTAYLHFAKPKEEVDNVYLTEDELDAIYRLPLHGHKAKARDIFLVGCYTAMRWSDFSRLQDKDVADDTIYFTHKKTGYRVSIPLHPIVKEVLERYDGSVPEMSEQKLNAYIKEVCREAGITQPVTKVYTKGGQRIEEVRQKCDMVTTHTARRTAATNMYKSGLPAYNIMLITGHTSEATFRKYIKFEKEQNAEMMRDNPYFRKRSEDSPSDR